MNQGSSPHHIAVVWSPEARSDLRAINRENAMQVLYCVDRYLAKRSGDVKKLKPDAFERSFIKNINSDLAAGS